MQKVQNVLKIRIFTISGSKIKSLTVVQDMIGRKGVLQMDDTSEVSQNLLDLQLMIRANFVLTLKAIVFLEIVLLTVMAKIPTFNVDAVEKYGNSTNRIDQMMLCYIVKVKKCLFLSAASLSSTLLVRRKAEEDKEDYSWS